MKKRFAFILSLVVLFLEIMPWGAVLNFALDSGKTVRRTYSYFSLTPYGYANFFPLLTAIISALFIIILILSFFKEKWEKSAFFLSFAGTILSLLPLTGGIRNFSLAGLGISFLLGLCALLLYQKEYLK